MTVYALWGFCLILVFQVVFVALALWANRKDKEGW
jgi:hypothetical protein